MKKMKFVVSLGFFFTLLQYRAQLGLETVNYIDSIVNKSYKSISPGVVVLVAQEGKPLYKKAFGMANLELNIPNKTEYNFMIGSMTKQFTAVCMLQLVEKNKVDLKDDIKKYLPEYNSHGRKITIENLLSHTSGITSYTELKDFQSMTLLERSKDDIIKSFSSDSLLFEPGTNWSYSNSGYFLAGLIIEKISGIPFEQYIQKNIFDVLGMDNTYIGSNRKCFPSLVNGYQQIDSVSYSPASYFNWSWVFTAGSIISNVDDLMKWDEALYSNKLVGKKLIEQAHTSFILKDGTKANYGLGWATGSYNNQDYVIHGGAINGFLSEGYRIPSKHLYVVILCNNESISPISIAAKIAFKVAGNSLKKPIECHLSSTDALEYEGVYKIHRSGSRLSANITNEELLNKIFFKNDTLYTLSSGGSKNVLVYAGDDLFYFKRGYRYIKFNRDLTKKIVSLEIYNIPNYGPSDIQERTNKSLLIDNEAIKIDSKLYSQFVGKYQLTPDFFISVFTKDERIFIKASGQSDMEIFPLSETEYFFSDVDAKIYFQKDALGKTTSLILHQGRKMNAIKIE